MVLKITITLKMLDEKRSYEGMFLLDVGASDFKTASEPVVNVLGRSEAELLAIRPWDERRLAYDIKGRRRGLYVLAYFKVAPPRVAEIEHDCELDERILRALILRREPLSDEQLNAETPATTATRKAAESRSARREPPPTEPAKGDEGDKAAPKGDKPPAAAPTPAEPAEAPTTPQAGPVTGEAGPNEHQAEQAADKEDQSDS